MRRALTRGVGAIVGLSCGVAVIVVGLRIAVLLLHVTFGAKGTAGALLEALEFMGLWSLWSSDALVVGAVLAVPAIVGLSRRGGAGGRLSAAALVSFLVIAWSYRFVALLGCVTLAIVLWRRSEASGRAAWALVPLVLTLSLLPVDVSLRVRPLGPRFAAAASGGDLAADEAGEIVVVGAGCYSVYAEPKWIWVW